MDTNTKNILVICGPTASGKTHLAVSLASRLHGEIISADSRQVYRRMDIGTGKDKSEYRTETGATTCHLIDIVEPADMYTLYHYQRDCFSAIQALWRQSHLPILTGGTGLYIEAVLKNYAIPNVPEQPELRKQLLSQTKEELLAQLAKASRTRYAATDISSKKRIARALEVALYAENHADIWETGDYPVLRPVVIGISWPREILINRINTRLHARLEQGMVEEVRGLMAEGISAERLSLFGMEYKQIARFLNHEVTYETMVEELARDIRRLAKRQMTWFRGMERRGIPVQWVQGDNVHGLQEIIDNCSFEF